MSSKNEKLIELVKKHECLYNKNSRGYKNVIKKMKLWEDIGAQLGLSAEECSKKWKSIRDRHTREFKKIESSNGGSANQLDESKWELMEHLSFLKDMKTPNRLISTTNGTPENVTDQKDPLLIISTAFTEQSPSTAFTEQWPSTTSGPLSSSSSSSNSSSEQMNHSTSRRKSKRHSSATNKDDEFGQAVGLMIKSISNERIKQQTKAYIFQYIANTIAQQT